MHHHSIRKPGSFRGWLHFDAPMNPICWLRGHSPRARVIDSRYIESWVLQDCRVCGRRYEARTEVLKLDPKVDWKDVSRQRVEVCRRDPVAFAQGMSRRAGWAERDVTLGVEAVNRKARARMRSFGWRFHVGNDGSETPFDGWVDVGVAAVYWSVGGIGNRLATFLGRGHKRDLSLQVHNGSVWWRLWYDDDGGSDSYHDCDSWRSPKLWPWSRGRRKHRSWMCLRDGSVELNPADALWGRAKPTRTELDVKSAFVEPAPGERYLVEFTLERVVWAREHGPRWARRVTGENLSVDWDARPGGIPFRNDSWKGDEAYAGSGPRLTGDPSRWLEEAVAGLEASIRRDRKRYRYSPPKEARQ